MRGILSYGTHVPYHRLDLATIGATMGSGGGQGTRSVASFDEDTTTMSVEAAREAMNALHGVTPDSVWLSTARPAYLEKTNATAIHAALMLPSSCAALDLGGATRSGIGALRTALEGSGTTLAVSADMRNGLPTSEDEAIGGDGAAAFVVGEGAESDLVAQYLGGATATAEFLDRWRTPGEIQTRQWEQRFGETQYVPLAEEAWKAALDSVGLNSVDKVIITGVHERSQRRIRAVVGDTPIIDDLSGTVGNTGTAHPGLLLAAALETASPAETLAVVMAADGVEVLIFRVGDAVASHRPTRTTAQQIAHNGTVSYAKFLQWRGMLQVQPPNRPEPGRMSGPAAARSTAWKYGFVASAGNESGLVHMPPARVSTRVEDTTDAQTDVPMAGQAGTIVTFTVDHLVFSVSPPVVFAVVDFAGGGRMPMELTDVDPDQVRVGDRVQPTFRRMNTADGIHNYFWKARPLTDPALHEESG